MEDILIGFIATDIGNEMEVRIDVQGDRAEKIKKILSETHLGETAMNICDEVAALACSLESELELIEYEEEN